MDKPTFNIIQKIVWKLLEFSYWMGWVKGFGYDFMSDKFDVQWFWQIK